MNVWERPSCGRVDDGTLEAACSSGFAVLEGCCGPAAAARISGFMSVRGVERGLSIIETLPSLAAGRSLQRVRMGLPQTKRQFNMQQLKVSAVSTQARPGQ